VGSGLVAMMAFVTLPPDVKAPATPLKATVDRAPTQTTAAPVATALAAFRKIIYFSL
jgi:hypothetical protein